MNRLISLAVLTVVLAATAASVATAESTAEPTADPSTATATATAGSTSATAVPGNLTEQNGDMTYYDLGLTACGQTYTNADMVAALAFDWFTTPNPNEDPMCGRQVRITDPATSKTVQVEVRDKCEGCQHDDIDVSPAAFQSLQPLDVGRYKVSWDFV